MSLKYEPASVTTTQRFAQPVIDWSGHARSTRLVIWLRICSVAQDRKEAQVGTTPPRTTCKYQPGRPGSAMTQSGSPRLLKLTEVPLLTEVPVLTEVFFETFHSRLLSLWAALPSTLSTPDRLWRSGDAKLRFVESGKGGQKTHIECCARDSRCQCWVSDFGQGGFGQGRKRTLVSIFGCSDFG